MPTETKGGRCITCSTEKTVVKCVGCSKDFCSNHLPDHRQQITVQLDQIEGNRDLFRQILIEQTNNSKTHSLTNQIDKWEEDSIRKIQQTANECRQLVLEHTTKHINQIEINLAKLTDQLKQTRQENQFNEINLRELEEKLTELTEALDKPPIISIRHDSVSLINKISVVVSPPLLPLSFYINNNTKWQQNGFTIAGGNGRGNELNELDSPCGICIDDDQHIYIVDSYNDRILQLECDGKNHQVVASENGEEYAMDRLSFPTDVIIDKKNDSLIICDGGNDRVVRWPRRNGINGQIIISDIDCSRLAIDKNGDLYISNWKKNEVSRWKIGDTDGTIVAGGNGEGNQLNQFHYPTYIFVDENHSVYVTDRKNHRVMKWLKDAKEGTVVAGGNGNGNSLTQLSNPEGLIVDHLGNVYVADSGNQRIMRWSPGSKEGSIVVDRNGQGKQSNQFDRPTDISFDGQGNLYIVDDNNHQVQKFDIDLS